MTRLVIELSLFEVVQNFQICSITCIEIDITKRAGAAKVNLLRSAPLKLAEILAYVRPWMGQPPVKIWWR